LGKSHALISTNVLARGIDVPEVDIVINYDVPVTSDAGYFEPDYANYLHRVGRTGRFQTDGIAVTLYVDDRDGVQENLMKKISEYWEKDIQQINSFEEFMKLFYDMRPNLKPGEKDF
jgi:ATP-dependent RNA helicase DDX19/DBP5